MASDGPPGQLDASCPLTLIHGPAPALRRRVLDRIVAAYLPESERAWGLVTLDAQEAKAEGILSQLGTGSLMAEMRVVVIRDLDRLPAAQQKTVAGGLRNLAAGTIVVVDVTSGDDYRRKGPPVAADVRKTFEEQGQIIEASAPGDRDLPAWIVEEAAQRGKTMPQSVAHAFVETVGVRLDLILSELDKLVAYVGPEHEEISAQDVAAVACGERENTVFELVDAIGRRDAQTALSVLPVLLDGGGQGGAMGLLAMVARQLRLVWQARVLGAHGIPLQGEPPPEWSDRLPKEHNFFDATRRARFLARKYAEQARNFSDVQLVRALVKVHETDLALKGQTDQRMDERLALETLIVSLCRL